MANMMRVSKTLLNAAKNNATTRFKDEGVKHALQKTVQTGAAGGALEGGLAYLQGDDPWEAAKGGIMKGALLGTGYQGLRFATNANKKTFKGNLKHATRATNIGISKQVRAIQKQKRMVEVAKKNLNLQ